MTNESIQVVPISKETESAVASLLRRNLETFNERETVLVSTFRRLARLHEIYTQEACKFLIATDASRNGRPVACCGLGPFHNLPLSEGLGEIRDLVVDKEYRGQGLGKLLLDMAIKTAKAFGYQRLYLETSQTMTIAQRLFEQRGFRPVTDQTPFVSQEPSEGNYIPCYYLLEKL
ncbi:MAG: GNAT family N-acetyltransferase [Deltaproteobacteria bacterium]|nr:GNAT family N-acetyltransferase [Deltaproteobacteria bacterium]